MISTDVISADADLEPHRPAVMGHCYRMLGPTFDADDAVQETMIRTWKARDRFDGIGIALLICTLLYVIPRTSIWGAILLTGCLGGAVATNVRASTVLFNVLFPVIFAIILWTSLVMRTPRMERVLFTSEPRES